MIPPLILEVIATANAACDDFRQRFSNIKLAPYSGQQFEQIYFDFDGVRYLGTLCGRNANLCPGHGAEADKGIAMRVFLDRNFVEA